MPIYDFKCNNCENIWDELIDYDKIPKCPKCNSDKVNKLISIPATAQFKGSGFFVNDYPLKK